jgi:hypothetical protein
MNVAVLKGEYSLHQGSEAKEAAAEVRQVIAELADMVRQDLDYWGVPESERRHTGAGLPRSTAADDTAPC